MYELNGCDLLYGDVGFDVASPLASKFSSAACAKLLQHIDQETVHAVDAVQLSKLL